MSMIIFFDEKAEIPIITHNMASIKAGFNMKKISLSSIIDTVPITIIKPVSAKINLSIRLNFKYVKINSTIPKAVATINPILVPHISSAITKTIKGNKPGSIFFNNSILFIINPEKLL